MSESGASGASGLPLTITAGGDVLTVERAGLGWWFRWDRPGRATVGWGVTTVDGEDGAGLLVTSGSRVLVEDES